MLGFIGTGNMGTAIIDGVISSGLLSGEEIAVFDLNIEKSKAISEKYGVKVLNSEKEIALKCDKIVLSVKPNVFATLLPSIDSYLKESNPLIISIAAGKTIEFIGSYLTYDAKIVRVMPNINAMVSQAISAYCANEKVNNEDLAFVNSFCSSFGEAVNISEKFFPIFGVIGGCSPAYAYMFIDSMARAAVKNGMPKDVALKISAQAVLGSAKMILESEEHPWELIDKVCSPGGTTIEGVLKLKEDGFESAVQHAVDAAFEKDNRI